MTAPLSAQHPQDIRSRAQTKFRAVHKTYARLRDVMWTPKGVQGTFLNSDVLMLAMVSYAQDIERLRTFHGIVVADEPKQACYLMKWIIKSKPVQFTPQGLAGTEDHYVLNEVLALFVALGILKVRPAILSEDYMELLLYTLRFRAFEEDSWLPMLNMLWRLMKMQANLPAAI